MGAGHVTAVLQIRLPLKSIPALEPLCKKFVGFIEKIEAKSSLIMRQVSVY
jgi:hypothetical protein